MGLGVSLGTDFGWWETRNVVLTASDGLGVSHSIDGAAGG